LINSLKDFAGSIMRDDLLKKEIISRSVSNIEFAPAGKSVFLAINGKSKSNDSQYLS
jgi:hypothetical protein